MSKKLSVIVPVYNGEQFIGACLDSLVTQLRDDVEIILINDGSTDATEQIIRSKFQKFLISKSIVYLPTPNGGVSAARNLGLDLATGDYVAFVDADDLVSSNYVSTILKAITNLPCIIEFGYKTVDQHGLLLQDRCFVHTKFGTHTANAILNTVFSACLWYPVLRVSKRQLFEGIRFPLGVHFCEDLILLSAVYKKAVTINSIDRVLYTYRQNPAGATINVKPDYAIQLIAFYRRIVSDTSFANKALKINLAYAIRRCTIETSDPLGRMPQDIEADIRLLLLTPSLFFHVRLRLLAYAFWGPFINGMKIFIKKRINVSHENS